MAAELKDWEAPDAVDFGRMKKADRVQWRRLFTINWLYDLVNLFSAPVIQRRNRGAAEDIDLASVDWSAVGRDTFNDRRPLHGLHDLASAITSLCNAKAIDGPQDHISYPPAPGVPASVCCRLAHHCARMLH
jgi:hypothetical protein